MAVNKGVVSEGDYTFDKDAKTITFSASYTGIRLSDVMYIRNVVTAPATVIYDPDTPGKGGSVSSLVLTLDWDTSGMNNSDPLQIIIGMNSLDKSLSETDFDTKTGSLTETAPASDTASSGLNGRLQRIAQRITSLIALLPTALTGSGNLKAAIVEDTTSNKSVNVAQINGVTPLMGAGNTGTGSPRVTIATDQADVAVKIIPQTSGGVTTYHLSSAATTNATVVRSAACQLYGWSLYNNTASIKKITFHNTASTPTAGASVFFTIILPANSGANAFFETGIAFSAGLSITTVTGAADSNSTAVAADDMNINLFYK